jgi:serine/threonine protein kinase
MLCSNCGAKNKENSLFCYSCGCDIAPTEFSGGQGAAEPPKARLRKGGPTLNRGRYEIIKEIASGGMGKIYLADDYKTNTLVVVKQMLPVAETDEELDYLEKRFHEEGMLLYNLRHRALPQVLDLFTKGQNFYIIMEYIEGENLSQFIKRKPNNRITIEECIYFLDKVLDILQFLHSQTPSVIHRDIKPGNIMINNLGEVVLVDFGLARSFDSESVGTARVGTYGFASPEHFTGKFKLSSDLYCTGVTFHYLLSGEDPRMRIPFEFPPLSKYRNDVPEGLQQVFNKLLTNNPDDRFQRAEDVKKALENFRDDQLRAFLEAPMQMEEQDKSAIAPAGKVSEASNITSSNITSIGEASGRFDLRISDKAVPRIEQKPEKTNGSNGINPEDAANKDEKTINGNPVKTNDKKAESENGVKISSQPFKPDSPASLSDSGSSDSGGKKINPVTTSPENSIEKQKNNSKKEKKALTLNPEKRKKNPVAVIIFLLVIVGITGYFAYTMQPALFRKHLPFLFSKTSPEVKPGYIVIDTAKTNIAGALVTVTARDSNGFGQNGTATYEGDSLIRETSTSEPASNTGKPVSVPVPPGIYTIKIARKNCVDLVIREQEVKSSQSFEINQPLVELPAPVITVKTNVEAAIYIGDVEKGKTTAPGYSLEIPVEAGAAFDIHAKKDGYESAKAGPVTMEMGTRREYYLNLEEIREAAAPPAAPTPLATETGSPAAEQPSPSASLPAESPTP